MKEEKTIFTLQCMCVCCSNNVCVVKIHKQKCVLDFRTHTLGIWALCCVLVRLLMACLFHNFFFLSILLVPYNISCGWHYVQTIRFCSLLQLLLCMHYAHCLLSRQTHRKRFRRVYNSFFLSFSFLSLALSRIYISHFSCVFCRVFIRFICRAQDVVVYAACISQQTLAETYICLRMSLSLSV